MKEFDKVNMREGLGQMRTRYKGFDEGLLGLEVREALLLILGEGLSSQVVSTELSGGCLSVHTASDAAKSEITYNRTKLQHAVNKSLNRAALKEIRVL